MDQRILKFLLPLFILPFFIILPDRFSPAWLVTDVEGSFSPLHCPEIAQITAQPLHYLGHGLQSIAFVSRDGKYVLKFFLKGKLRRGIRFGLKSLSLPRACCQPTRGGLFAAFCQIFGLSSSSTLLSMPPPSTQKSAEKSIENPPEGQLTTRPHHIRYDLLQRYDKAFCFLKEETGLIAVHLAASPDPLPSCTVYDSRGHLHTIDLTRASFVIQRCGTPLNQLSSKEKKKALPTLQQLLEARARKGFTDSKDRLNENNFALLEDQAIMIDLGNVVFSEELRENPASEVERVRDVLERWIKEKF